jgi:hypothetical protein
MIAVSFSLRYFAKVSSHLLETQEQYTKAGAIQLDQQPFATENAPLGKNLEITRSKGVLFIKYLFQCRGKPL